MSVFVLNVGSSSLKFALFGLQNAEEILQGKIEHSAHGDETFSAQVRGQNEPTTQSLPASSDRLEFLFHWLQTNQFLDSMTMVAHRIVHGGHAIVAPTLITENTLEQLEELIPLAPLHMPAALETIRKIQRRHPSLKQAVVVDTAFFQSLPFSATLMPLPYELYTKHGIRRYGFHGISHEYCSLRAGELLRDRDLPDKRLILCHIGSGCSVTAMKGLAPIDTTMGFTPLDGLMMATRSGAIDPGIIIYLQKQLGWQVDQIDQMLNHQSGLLGVSQRSSDFRRLCEWEDQDPNAAIAIRMFVDRIRKTIGAYTVQLGGLDGLIFTAGIGENSESLRRSVCQGLECIGVHLDLEANRRASGDSFIHSEDSAVAVMTIHTQEEVWIARQVRRHLMTS